MIGKMMTRKGFSLMEMLVVVGILALLASASVPVAELAFNTAKEDELQTALDRMREAINLYRRDCRNAVVTQIGYDNLNLVPFSKLCPRGLESLTNDSEDVEIIVDIKGVTKTVNFKHRRYLDNIPVDPFVGRPCWLIHVASGTCRAAYNLRSDGPAGGISDGSGSRGFTDSEFGMGNQDIPGPEPFWEGVFDVSCVASNTVDADDYYTRRGFNISVDGTLYEDW